MSSEPRSDKDTSGKFISKARDSLLTPISITGMAIVCGVGAYRNRFCGALSTPALLMRLKAAAQGTVLMALGLGISGSIANEHVLDKRIENKAESLWLLRAHMEPGY